MTPCAPVFTSVRSSSMEEYSAYSAGVFYHQQREPREGDVSAVFFYCTSKHQIPLSSHKIIRTCGTRLPIKSSGIVDAEWPGGPTAINSDEVRGEQ